MIFTDRFNISEQSNSFDEAVEASISHIIFLFLQKVFYFIENKGCLAELMVSDTEEQEGNPLLQGVFIKIFELILMKNNGCLRANISNNLVQVACKKILPKKFIFIEVIHTNLQ